MKKVITVILLASLLLLCGCTGRGTMEENDANAPVTVEDKGRPTATDAPTTSAAVTSPLTGRPVLDEVSFSVPDPENTRGLPTAKIGHSYGVAKNGIVHDNSKNAQSFFESKGYRALCYDTTPGTKALYLTFDCGYENGYTPVILDTLKEADVKAIFFVTQTFIRDNPDLVKRMKEEGHMVGNHTITHPSLPGLSIEEQRAEIRGCADYMKEVTGYEMDPYIRPPKGEYSERTLQLCEDMGYCTLFWSIAYLDYDVNNQPSPDYVLQHFDKYCHPGAMPLIHNVSSANTQALPQLIRNLREAGYRFGTVDEFCHF